ncbi:hypothetical protein F5Y18DRAFT_423540 [Xylariaceae sp. FL1019]|nr:hypothetical protein F5Y18DRAFT_423540 [Xylariaceae sp. FL1019]
MVTILTMFLSRLLTFSAQARLPQVQDQPCVPRARRLRMRVTTRFAIPQDELREYFAEPLYTIDHYSEKIGPLRAWRRKYGQEITLLDFLKSSRLLSVAVVTSTDPTNVNVYHK